VSAAIGDAASRGIQRINPVAKLAAAFLLAITLVLTLDWVSASVALALESILFARAGVSWRQFWLRTLPAWIAAPVVSVTITLYGRESGRSYFHWLLIDVTDGSIGLGIATGLRVLAIGLPAIVLFVTIDPTDLADGLAQVWHLPARFVLGSLAALRLLGLFMDDWRSLERARRARGIADRGRIRRFGSQAFSLLVLSIRRGSKLATAMEARAFGADIRRTWARESRFGAAEWFLVALGAAICAIAVTVSAVTGHWNFIGA
jgi:energy-coupling factor transport system permease protein